MPMTALDFDTHKAVKNLQKAGFEEPAAEALIDTIDTAVRAQVATKADLEVQEQRLGRRMDNLRHETKSDMDNLRSDFRSLGQETRARLDVMGERMDGLEKNLIAQMVILKRDVTIRLGGLMVAGIGVLAALEVF